jgi:hypothetical protein
MLENRTSAVHGQICINSLIEAILEHVDIPLTLQEIEGDAVFLYARHPGTEAGWDSMLRDISVKLGAFFDAFIKQLGITTESTPCGCAICRNADQLGLKILVHTGEAVFHTVAGRTQVSGPDVILAHRLLKNAVQSSEYLLLTEVAFDLMGQHLPGSFEAHEESYEGFGPVRTRVRFLEQEALAARDAVYRLNDDDLKGAVDSYLDWVQHHATAAAVQQMRAPIRPFSWIERLLMVLGTAVDSIALRRRLGPAIMRSQRSRGRRRSSSPSHAG